LKYYVLHGNDRYGPADLDTLRSWMAEGRVHSQSLLEEAPGGRRCIAGQLPGLAVAAPPAGRDWSAPPPASPYPRAGTDDGTGDATISWICSALGLLLCFFVLPIVGLVYANRAQAKGNPSAPAARIFAIVVLVIDSLYALAVLAVIASTVVGFSIGLAVAG
jgi:hypothetical protein